MDSLAPAAPEPARVEPPPGEVININAVELPAWALAAARKIARVIKSGPGVYVIRVSIPARGPAAPELLIAKEETLWRG